jgi:hypothetical protein
VLHGICAAYEDFYNAFCKIGNNYKNAQVYKNDIFRDPGSGNTLGKSFFGNDFYAENRDKIRNLTFDHCYTAIGFKTMNEFSRDGLRLPLAVWMRLRNALSRTGTLLRNNTGPSVCINNFTDRWRKGGRRIRRFRELITELELNVRNTRSFITFSGLVNALPPIDHNLGLWCSLWNINSLSNDFRMFIFNTRYNYLPLNNRLNSYLPEVDPACTYCVITKELPAPKDSFQHCFLHCNTARRYLLGVLSMINFNANIDSLDFQKMYWYGVRLPYNSTLNLAFLIFFDAFRYIFFKNRLRRHMPELIDFKIEFTALMIWICRFNRTIKTSLHCAFPNTFFLQAIG